MRFLAKIALELLVYRNPEEDWMNEVVVDTQLDPIRNYARYGKGKFWDYHQRRIYDEGDRFINPITHKEPYEILHEFDFLYTEHLELYAAIVIMGLEFTINLGGPETDGYITWLEENNYACPIKRGSEVMLPAK